MRCLRLWESKTKNLSLVCIYFEEISVNLFDGFQFYFAGRLPHLIFLEQRQQLLLITVIFQQFLATLVAESELPEVGALLQQEFEYLIVEFTLRFVHLHFGAAEVVNQRISVLLINYPVHIRPVFDQQLRYQKAYLLVFEAGGLLGQTEEGDGEGSLVHIVGFVDFSVGE